MRLVLDSNEFIFALGPEPEKPCARLLDLKEDLPFRILKAEDAIPLLSAEPTD